MLKGLYVLSPASYDLIYGPCERQAVAQLLDVCAPAQTSGSVQANPAVLQDVDVLLTGWGAPVIDAAFLAAAPRLRAVFYGAGSVRAMVTDALWARKIVVCSAWGANAVPVAEYTLSQVLFCLKRGWQHARRLREGGSWDDRLPVAGAYGSTVGIISLGMIGRLVCRHLRNFDVKVIAYDPFAKAETAAELGVSLTSLEELFRCSDVVSCHTPWLPQTEGLLTGAHFASMKEGAAFINTSRGAVVRQAELIKVLQDRTDLQAVLDVTFPEPPPVDSPLRTLPNVILTPHIAGSLQNECHRMGDYMVQDLRRYLAGEPLRWQVTREQAQVMA